MNQIYLVIEDNGESYEDYHEWAIAAFDDSDKASAYASKCKAEWDYYQEIGKQEAELYNNEFEIALENFDDYTSAEYTKTAIEVQYQLDLKYPNASHYNDYSIHSFRVIEPIPFNPS